MTLKETSFLFLLVAHWDVSSSPAFVSSRGFVKLLEQESFMSIQTVELRVADVVHQKHSQMKHLLKHLRGTWTSHRCSYQYLINYINIKSNIKHILEVSALSEFRFVSFQLFKCLTARRGLAAILSSSERWGGRGYPAFGMVTWQRVEDHVQQATTATKNQLTRTK